MDKIAEKVIFQSVEFSELEESTGGTSAAEYAIVGCIAAATCAVAHSGFGGF